MSTVPPGTNRCRYCAVPIPDYAEPEPIWRTRWNRTTGRRIQETYDARVPLDYCSERHKRAAAGNRDARADAVNECRDDGDDEEPEPPMFDPNQGSLL